MCGICGVYSFADDSINKETIIKMRDILSHRGPDDKGIYLGYRANTYGYKIGLGHRRLSVIDLERGHQPMVSEDKGLCIVYNGEIYNFRELRKKLLNIGHIFKTASDTEVVLKSYAQWGPDCLNQFNGMFSFAIWDDREKSLFLARDRIGIKPLYYCKLKQMFIFASEIKPILQFLNRAEVTLDEEALYDYLTFMYIPAPKTPFREIKKLLPGHYAFINDKGNFRVTKYWDLALADNKIDNEEKLVEKIWWLMEDSVKMRLVSDVPIGAFLSGGLDSGSVVGLMDKYTEDSVNTFSVGFGMKDTDELSRAKLVAERFNTKHNEILVGEESIKKVPSILRYLDEPFGGNSILPTYFISKFAKEKGVSVILTGDGGDELFGGYDRYKINYQSPLANFYKKLPLSIRNNLEHLLKTFHPNLGKINRLGFELEERYLSVISLIDDDFKKDLLLNYKKDFCNQVEILKRYMDRNKSKDIPNSLMLWDIKIYAPDCYLFKVDRMSMSSGLEIRTPFLDHRLVEFMVSLPSRYKHDGINSKSLFRKVIKDFLPEELFYAPKYGFSVPIKRWINGNWGKYIRDILLDETTIKRKYFNVKKLKKIMAKGRYNSIEAQMLWSIFILELWFREIIDSL